MQKSASAPSGSFPGSTKTSANNSISLANVPRHHLPIGVSPLVASRMRLDATISPAMLDLRMNTRNLINEMQYNGGKIVSHQFALMRPRRNEKREKPKDLGKSKAIRKLQKRVKTSEDLRMKSQALKEEALENSIAKKTSSPSADKKMSPVNRQINSDDKGDEEIELDDPNLDDEVARLLKEPMVEQVWRTMQSKGEDEPEVPGLPRSKIARALEALGLADPDKDTVREALSSLPGDAPLALDEFASIVAIFHRMRRAQLREHFRRLDDDNSGTIGVREFKHLLWDLGLTVTEEAVKEYLNEADEDHSGEVEFAEFEYACNLVHQRHGFSKAEVHEFEALFDRYDADSSHEMEAEELAGALGWFGSAVTMEEAQEIIRRFDDDEDGCLARPEFLLVMRQRLEEEISEVRSLFHDFDTDGSGTMDVEELLELFMKCGYTITADVIVDAIKAALPKSIAELMFEDVLKVFYLVRKREGFSESELSELTDVFNRHDGGAKGELREFELGRCFNWLGYPLSVQRRRELWVRVDVDKTESIEPSEFLKLVRILREEETAAVKSLLSNCPHIKGSGKSVLPEESFNNMLKDLGYFLPKDIIKQALNQSVDSSGDGTVDMHGVFGLLRWIRDRNVEKLRSCAGITDQQSSKMRGKFSLKTKAGKAVPEADFFKVMYEMFPVAKHDPGRQAIMRKIFKEQTGEKGLTELTEAFWIVRLYADARDEDKWNREQKAAAEAGFTHWQVASFREAFLVADVNGDGSLSESEIQTVFQDLMKLSLKQFQSMTHEFHRMGDKSDAIEFADFIRLMRIVLNAGH